jgi:hypothetical protein
MSEKKKCCYLCAMAARHVACTNSPYYEVNTRKFPVSKSKQEKAKLLLDTPVR